MHRIAVLDGHHVIRGSVCPLCLESIEEKVNSNARWFFRVNERFFGHVYQESTGLQHLHIRCFDCDSRVRPQEVNKCYSCTSDSSGRQLEFIVNRFSRNVVIREALPPFSYTREFREILSIPVRGSERLIDRIIPEGGIVEGGRLGVGAFASSMFLSKVLSYTNAESDARFAKYSLGLGILAGTMALNIPGIQRLRDRLSAGRTAQTVLGVALGTLGASLAWTALRMGHKLVDSEVEVGVEVLRLFFMTAAVVPVALLHIGGLYTKHMQDQARAQLQAQILLNREDHVVL